MIAVGKDRCNRTGHPNHRVRHVNALTRHSATGIFVDAESPTRRRNNRCTVEITFQMDNSPQAPFMDESMHLAHCRAKAAVEADGEYNASLSTGRSCTLGAGAIEAQGLLRINVLARLGCLYDLLGVLRMRRREDYGVDRGIREDGLIIVARARILSLMRIPSP